MATAWMIRNDRTAIPCVCHTYGNWDVQEIEETLSAAQWLYEYTAKDATQKLCMELIYAWAEQLSTAKTGILDTIFQTIDNRPYRFLSKEFISAHTEELKKPVYEQSLESLNEDLNLDLNQEFLRARYGGLYDTDPDSHEMFFRISSTAFDWYSIIRDFVERSPFPIESITIVRDAESTGGGNRAYWTLNGQGVYRQLPLQDFLAEQTAPAAQGKRLAAGAPSAAVIKEIIEGLADGHSLRELRDLPINWERLKQQVKRHSRRELKLTAEGRECGRTDFIQ